MIVGFTGDRQILSVDIPVLHKIIDRVLEERKPTEVYYRLDGYVDIEIIKYIHATRKELPTTLYFVGHYEQLHTKFKEVCFLPHKVIFFTSKLAVGGLVSYLAVNARFFELCDYEVIIWTGVEGGWFVHHVVNLELYEKDFEIVPLQACTYEKSASAASVKITG